MAKRKPFGYYTKGRGADRKVHPLFEPKGVRLPKAKSVHPSRDEAYQNHIEREMQSQWTHTGGVKKINGYVLKPLRGRIRTFEGHISYRTKEYEAIKSLEDLPHIPKDVKIVTKNDAQYMKREDYLILENGDYKSLKREDLISIEKTIRMAHERGWTINDDIQLGYSPKHNEYVIYDWSNAEKIESSSKANLGMDETAIKRLWEKAGYLDYIKAREWADRERFKERLSSGYKKRPNYTYMSFARPPIFYDYPKGTVTRGYIVDKPWKPLGLIHTEEPLSEETIKNLELTPTKYV